MLAIYSIFKFGWIHAENINNSIKTYRYGVISGFLKKLAPHLIMMSALVAIDVYVLHTGALGITNRIPRTNTDSCSVTSLLRWTLYVAQVGRARNFGFRGRGFNSHHTTNVKTG